MERARIIVEPRFGECRSCRSQDVFKCSINPQSSFFFFFSSLACLSVCEWFILNLGPQLRSPITSCLCFTLKGLFFELSTAIQILNNYDLNEGNGVAKILKQMDENSSNIPHRYRCVEVQELCTTRGQSFEYGRWKQPNTEVDVDVCQITSLLFFAWFYSPPLISSSSLSQQARIAANGLLCVFWNSGRRGSSWTQWYSRRWVTKKWKNSHYLQRR